MSPPRENPGGFGVRMSGWPLSAAKDGSGSSGMFFRPTLADREMNAYLITHPGIDLQKWFEALFQTKSVPS
jgi:hypothetical protein